MWYHSIGNSLSVSTWHSYLGKLGNKCRGHPIMHWQLPRPPWWSAWVIKEFQAKWHAIKYKYFPLWKTTRIYWQSLYYFHVARSMTHGHHQCTDCEKLKILSHPFTPEMLELFNHFIFPTKDIQLGHCIPHVHTQYT